ncbi:unnamed protein product [Rhizopus stolonifer]
MTITAPTHPLYSLLGQSPKSVDIRSCLKIDVSPAVKKTRDGYQPFQQELPCGLKSDMQGHDIVSLLGEPDKKGGGGQTGTPCWIEYLFEAQRDSGIVIQLHGFEWEDCEMGWTSLVLY